MAKKIPLNTPSRSRAASPLPDWLEPGVWVVLGLLLLFWIAFVYFGTFRPLTQDITGVDPVGYYSWARSILFDFDLDFENEYRVLNPEGAREGDTIVDPDAPRTDTGKLGNAFAMGPGLLWLPFLVLGHVAAGALDFEANGFTQPYFSAVVYANMVYGWAALLLMYGALRKWFDQTVSAIAAIAAFAASPALYYTYAQESMSHACSMFAVALLLFAWSRLREKEALWAWGIIGACVGLAALMRWQNAAFAVIVATDLLWRDQARNFPKMAVSAGAAIIVFFPQMFGWYILYGSFVTIPQGQGFLDWTTPDVLAVFFSRSDGLFLWTPLTAVGIAGLFFIPKDGRRIYAGLVIAFVLQVYVTAAAGEAGWSFSMRRMTNCVPLMAVGFALLMMRFRIPSRGAMVVAAVFVFWNFLFVLQYGGLIDPFYVDRALQAEHGYTLYEIERADQLPDGRPFDVVTFAEENRFPRDGALTFHQFVTDKRYVMGEVITQLLLIGADRG